MELARYLLVGNKETRGCHWDLFLVFPKKRCSGISVSNLKVFLNTSNLHTNWNSIQRQSTEGVLLEECFFNSFRPMFRFYTLECIPVFYVFRGYRSGAFVEMGLKCCRIHSKTPVLHVLKETLIQVFSCNISQNPCGWLLLKTPLYSTFPLEGLLKELPSQTSHILVFLFVFLCSLLWSLRP